MSDLGMRLLLVGAGGALGAVSRYAINLAAIAAVGERFPLGTLLVNSGGCLAAGAVFAWAASPEATLPPQVRLLVMTGFLGGLTTFSAFSVETLAMAQQQQWGRAALNIGLNLTLSLFAAWAGFALVRSLSA